MSGNDNTRADWMHAAKWGVMTHFLVAYGHQGEDVDADTWNRRVDAFDVQGLARQLREARARYFLLTLGQMTGHYCAPNATYDRITGIYPSLCARRDIVAELYDALAPHGIRLMVYLTGSPPEYSTRALEKLGWIKGERSVEFQRKWESVIREWALRWGRKVSGWWFDCCYYDDAMYRHAEEPNFRSFAAAVRAGNPDSSVAWNPGVIYPPFTVDAEEDYTAGEVNDPQAFDAPGRWDKQAQFHILTFLGKNWAHAPMRFTASEAITHTLAFTDYGGAVTWDVPITYTGLLKPEALPILNEIGKAVDATRGRPDLTPPKVVRPAVTFIETPALGDKGRKTGRVGVELKNNWNEPIRGHVTFAVEPVSAGRMEDGGRVDYELQPGSGAKDEVGFSVGEMSATDTPVRLVLSRTGSEHPLIYPLPRRERIRIPRLADLPALEELEVALTGIPERIISTEQGHPIATVKLAVVAGQLAVFCRINDRIRRQTDFLTPWDGSCVEVFGVAEPGDRINQLFFVPATADAPARVSRLVATENDTKKSIIPSPDIKFMTWADATGYKSAALVPLSWWLKRTSPPERFLIEIVITAGLDPHDFSRVAVFGSANASICVDGYALAENGEES